MHSSWSTLKEAMKRNSSTAPLPIVVDCHQDASKSSSISKVPSNQTPYSKNQPAPKTTRNTKLSKKPNFSSKMRNKTPHRSLFNSRRSRMRTLSLQRRNLDPACIRAWTKICSRRTPTVSSRGTTSPTLAWPCKAMDRRA